ncbi:MAG: DUF222 domain-containing protein [Acidimicrobiia bacterium]
MEVLSEVPTEELRLRLAADERVIGRVRARQAARIRELDRRQAATAEGCGSLAEWVAGRIDVSPETAKTLAATAKALDSLPHTSGALADGELTWDRAVELARLATPDDELEALLGSYDVDVAGLRRRASRRRRISTLDERQAFADRYLVIQPTLDDSAWRLSGQLPGVAGKIVEQTLTDRADEFPAFPDGTKAPLRHRRADALVALCQGEDGPSPTVVVAVDATDDEASASVIAGPHVGPDTLRALLCGATAELVAYTGDGIPLGIGRRSRTVPPRLRRFIQHRDGGCVADGCTSIYRLEAHHRVPFSEGGRTDADNLVTLCWYHHHIVIHGHGFTIDPDSKPGRVRFRPPALIPSRDPP